MLSQRKNISSIVTRISVYDDQAAFEELYNLYFKWLKSVAMAIVRKNEDAEEIIEDVFVNIWLRRDKIQQINNIDSYLYTATKNKAYNYVKKYYKVYHEELDEESYNQPYIITPEDILVIDELKKKIELAVSKLPEKCREVYELVRQEGYSYKKAAEHLNLAPKTIENQLSIAIKKIKLELDIYFSNPSEASRNKLIMLLLVSILAFI